jgi:hypothetical protein
VIPVFCFCLLGPFSCMVTNSGVTAVSDKENEIISPRIIFLTYSIRRGNSAGEPEIQLISKSVADGKIKMNTSQPDFPKPGDLSCVALDSHLQPLESLIISDPLNITIESVDDNNALFKKEIAKESAQFFVRMQLNQKIFAIGIKMKLSSENQNSYLLITNIK